MIEENYVVGIVDEILTDGITVHNVILRFEDGAKIKFATYDEEQAVRLAYKIKDVSYIDRS